MGEGVQGHYESEEEMGLLDQFRVQHRYRNQLRALAQQCLSKEPLHQRCGDEQVAM
jgi:hypothetical protein